MTTLANHALASNDGGPSRLQSARPVAAVAELGSLGGIYMRARILILVTVLLAARTSQGQAWTAPPWDKAVIVRKLKEDFPRRRKLNSTFTV